MRTLARAIVLKDNQLLVMDRKKHGKRYITLPGGGIKVNERPAEAAAREVLEECSIKIINPRLVIILKENERYGLQYIYLFDYLSGQPKLDPEAIEAKLNAQGDNSYQPRWLKTEDLASSNLLPQELKKTLVEYLSDGFPEEVSELQVSNES